MPEPPNLHRSDNQEVECGRCLHYTYARGLCKKFEAGVSQFQTCDGFEMKARGWWSREPDTMRK